jgi:glycosyltransferase involved in cell wall biosynthesis
MNMRVLLVNKYHYLRGGDCRYVFDLAEMLKEKGHDVRFFSMDHPKNITYEHSNDFVSHIDFKEELKRQGIKPKIKTLSRIIYSKEARVKFGRIIEEFRPDVIHLNSIHKHLTSSIILEANKKRIPIVWTLHDFNLICPNISFTANNKVCESCKKLKYLAPIKMRCSNNSLASSTIIALEKMIHDIQRVKRRVNVFIAPSSFLRKKFSEFGFDENRIVVLPNFYKEESQKTLTSKTTKSRYFLFLGRIDLGKGLETLCRAAKNAGIRLILAGEGPLKDDLSARYGSEMIKFVGFKTGKELSELRKEAWFLVLPSECYENNPFSIIESFADGVPAIGAKIGGIPELVKDGKTGFLFPAGNAVQLEETFRKAEKMSTKQRNSLGKNAKEQIMEENNPRAYYKRVMAVYKKAISEGSIWKH